MPSPAASARPGAAMRRPHGSSRRAARAARAAKEAKLAYWAEQIDIQAALVGALALCAEGKQTNASPRSKAAAREDAPRSTS